MPSNRTPSPFLSPIRDSSNNNSTTKRTQHLLELQRQAQHNHHLSTMLSAEERRDFLKKQEESAAYNFLNSLPDDVNPIVNGHLQNLRHMEMPTQAFSKVKPSTNFSVTSSSTNSNINSNHGSGLPMCHYPETREAILTLLGPESESGTFPSSLLSAALTTRLGVTVSNNVPEQLLSLTKNSTDVKTKVDQSEKKVSSNSDDKAARNEFKKKILLARIAAASAANANNNFNNNSTLGKEFLDLSKEFEPSEDDDENEYVEINPDGTIKVDDDEVENENDCNIANVNTNKHAKKSSSSAVTLSNLPSGADLEEFPPILREGIRTAAIEIMQRHLGPRMKFLVTRQRRLSIMGEEIDFSNGGIIFAKNHNRIDDQNNSKRKISPAKRMTSTLNRRNNKNNSNNATGFTTHEEVKILAVSQIARNHSMSQVQQIVSDVMRRTCAPLQFLLPSSASTSSTSSGTQPTSSSFDPKFPCGIHFPACHELTSNSQLNQFLSATEKMHFSSSTGPFSPVSSFFANWSTEAMHSVINQGFLQIVPAGTQLCYQGSPVAVDKHSNTPSVYVILAGTCEVVFKSEDSVLPCGDARLYCGGDVYPPSLNDKNNNGSSKRQNQQVSSKKEDDDADRDDIHNNDNNNNNAGFGESKFGIFGGLSAQGKDLLLPPVGAASMNRRKSFSMLGGLNENNNNSSSDTTILSLNQRKQIGWETYFKSKGEYLVDESSALGLASHQSNNNNNPTTASLSAVSHQLYKIFTSSPSTASQNNNNTNEKTAAADLRAVENALFPLTSNKTQHMKAVVGVTPMMPNVGAASINVMSNDDTINGKNNSSSKKSISSSSSFEATSTCFRNVIGPMTALGPFGISMTSATSGNHSLPHPCSLRTSTQTNSKCEIFVIPYWALIETMKKGNYLASAASGEGKDDRHNNNNSNTNISLHGHKKHTASSVSPSDADQILFASACHQFSLIYFSTCCSRMLRKITWLLRPLSLNSNVIATATAAQHVPGTEKNRFDGQYFFSKELRARIASAFRPILISQDKITQYRSGMAITTNKDHGNNINGGNSSGAHNTNTNNNHGNNKTSGGLDPLAFLILPQIGSRARVQLTEAAHAAEASVVTVDALEPKTDTSKKMTTYAQVAQSRLRSDNGVEFSSDSAFAFGLREVFVTAGRRIMESHRSLFKTKRRVKNMKGNKNQTNSYDGKDDEDEDDDDDGDKNKRKSEGSSSSAVAHVGTFIAVSNANISRQEGVKIRAQSQLQGFLQQQQQQNQQQHHSSGSTPSSPALLGGSHNNSARDFSLLERRNSAINIPSSHFANPGEGDDTKVSGYVLCFVVCASELQKRILAYVTPNSHDDNNGNINNNNFFPDVYFRRREELKLLFQEADAKLVQYRTSAMATSAMRDEEEEEKLKLKIAQEAEKIKREKLEAKRKLKEEKERKKQQERDDQDALHPNIHQNETTKKIPKPQSKETASPTSKRKTLLSNNTTSSGKADEKNVSDSDSHSSASNSSSNSKNKNNKNRRSKSMILKKSVQELLAMALDKFPVVGPCCRLAHRDDILNIFSLLFEYKKYPPHSLVLSKADLAADRIVVILKGKVVLNAVKESYNHHHHHQNNNVVLENNLHENESNNDNQWKFLTFAGSTTVLPHRWNRSAVAITEVTTAEASRALVLPFFRDTGLFEAMKVFSEAVLSYPGIVSVPNFVVPDVVKTAMLCFGNSPLVHPILNSHHHNSSSSADNVTKMMHNVYGARSIFSMNQSNTNNNNFNNVTSSANSYTPSRKQPQSNLTSFLPNFHSKQEVQQEKLLEQNESTRREQQIEKLKKTTLNPPLFGQERKNRDEWREYKRQQQLAKEAEEKEQWEASNRKKERERKARENQHQFQQEGNIFSGNNEAGSLGSALININKSVKTDELNSHSSLPPIAGSKNNNSINQQKSGSVISRKENNQKNHAIDLGDDVADALFGTVTANNKKSEQPPIDFVQRHKDSFTPHPTVDALELLRSRGVILKDDFFLRNSLDPMTKQHKSSTTVHFDMENNQQNEQNNNSFPNRRSASTPVPTTSTTNNNKNANFLSDGGFFVGGCSTRKVIGKSHKSLATGLWVKKRAPIQMPK